MDDKTRMRGLIARIDDLLEESLQLQRTRSSWARHVEIQAEIMKLCRQYADLHGEPGGVDHHPFQTDLDRLRGDRPAADRGAPDQSARDESKGSRAA